MNVYHGGATPVPGDDIHLYLDNIMIARAPIGPAKAPAAANCSRLPVAV